MGGGNTANLLAVWRIHGLDDVLREAWESGVVLAGLSAGANCWFEASTTDSFGPLARAARRARPAGGQLLSALRRTSPAVARSTRGWSRRRVPAGDRLRRLRAAVHFVGMELADVVTSVASEGAFRVFTGDDGVQEEPIPARLLVPD